MLKNSNWRGRMGLCNRRYLLIPAAFAFFYIQLKLLMTQSEFADRIAAAVDAEHNCTIQTGDLIDKLSREHGRISVLEEERNRLHDECKHLNDLVKVLEKKNAKNVLEKSEAHLAAVVIMACNRPDYLERTVQSILKYQPAVAAKFPLFVSQDGSDTAVKNKVISFSQLNYMQHLDSKPVQAERPGEIIAYYKIARHYKWALDRLFFMHNFSRVIILEDDMEIAPDFFEYFEAAASLLDKDKTIMAVSSWNDNGQKQFVHDPYALYRSDFFPGLGWMLTKSTWDELSPKWPKAYWDDWLRLKENHKGRHFVRPEVCRTFNFGEHGSSMGQFYKQYLEPIKLNDVKVNWKSMNLSYLTEGKYIKHFASMVEKAKPVKASNAALTASNARGDVRIHYKDVYEFERIARQFGIFHEWKDGVPRTAYKGVVVFRYRGSKRVFLVGPTSLADLGIPKTT